MVDHPPIDTVSAGNMPPSGEPFEIVDDRPCLNCGYSIRGLKSDGRCPECGTETERSLRGNLLLYSSIDYLRSLQSGITMIVVAIAAQAFIIVGGITVGIGTAVAAANSQSAVPAAILTALMATTQLLSLAASLLLIAGWWMFSTPDPAVLGTETGETARRVVRVTVAIAAVTTIFSSLAELAETLGAVDPVLAMTAGGLGLIALIAGVVKFFAAMLYLRWIAPRVPDRSLDQNAKTYMWVLPLVFVVGLPCVGLGPLVATILYWLLLYRFRTRITTILFERRGEGAGLVVG